MDTLGTPRRDECSSFSNLEGIKTTVMGCQLLVQVIAPVRMFLRLAGGAADDQEQINE
jgi:hypothetical protein